MVAGGGGCSFLFGESFSPCGGVSGVVKQFSPLFLSFVEWMYPSGGGEENVESAALGIIILWTTW